MHSWFLEIRGSLYSALYVHSLYYTFCKAREQNVCPYILHTKVEILREEKIYLHPITILYIGLLIQKGIILQIIKGEKDEEKDYIHLNTT